MAKNSHFPNSIQVSILMAVAMLGYILTRYIDDPPQEIMLQLPNFFFSISISIQMIIALLVAGMLASGMYWLIQDHPQLDRSRAWHHVWLPALTAWATSTLLELVPLQSIVWWIVIILGGLVLVGVFVAEYIVVDITDAHYHTASIILTILAFCIYSAIILTWHNAAYRLFIIFPATFLAGGLLTMRILNLYLPESPVPILSASLAIISAHISASLHYIPISSLQYCLINVGVIYSCITLAINIHKQIQTLRIVSGPLAIAVIFFLSALLIK